MRIKFNKCVFLSSFILICATGRAGVDWPVLETHNPHKSAHPRIIASMVTKPSFMFRGGRFSAMDSIDQEINRDLLAKAKNILDDLNKGKRILVRPTSSLEVANLCTISCDYNVLIEDEYLLNERGDRLIFRLRHRPEISQRNIDQPVGSDIPSDLVAGQETFDIIGNNPLCLGSGFSEFSQIKSFIENYSNNSAVRSALKIIAASDLADHIDIKKLTKFIKKSSATSAAKLDVDGVVSRINNDIFNLTEANKFCKTCSVPFRAQIKQMLGYKRNTTIYGNAEGALSSGIRMIREFPMLLEGEIPEVLRNVKSFNLFALRTALFYIAQLKNPEGFVFLRPKLSGFYSGELEGEKIAQSHLNKTLLVQGNTLFTPACSYIKNADKIVDIRDTCGYGDTFKMRFTDCSGFILNIARLVYPDMLFLQSRQGLTSYHLAALYDLMANEIKGTADVFYSSTDANRALTRPEVRAIGKLKIIAGENLSVLLSIFEPVLDIKELKTGDILIQRHIFGFHDKEAPVGEKGAEGHALLVVYPDPKAPISVELTSGHGLGYGWRKVNIRTRDNLVWRILRFKNLSK